MAYARYPGGKILENRRAQSRLVRFFRTLTHLLALAGFLLLVVTATPLVSWWAGKLAGPWNDPGGDVLIVLAGSAGDGGEMGYSSYLRSQYAVDAYKTGGFHAMVVSGSGAPRPAATTMSEFMTCRGVPANTLRLETASRSTRENALFSRALINSLPGNKVLLTSDYHMFRAYRAFRKLGIDVLPRPIPDARKQASRWRGRWSAFLEVVVETVKIAYYYARGWI